MPSVGRIERVRFPHGPGVRVDGGFYRGYEIPVFYDSLLSKLVTWGRDREQARRRMVRALSEYVLEGPKHNIAFHMWLMDHPEFVKGNLSTKFLDEHFKPSMLQPDDDARDTALLAAALHQREERLRTTIGRREDALGPSAWRWAPRARG